MARALVPAALALVLLIFSLPPVQVFGAAPPTSGPGVGASADNEPDQDVRVCSSAPSGEARCHSRLRTDSKVKGKKPARVAVPSANTIGNGGAYDPSYLQSAYNLGSAAAAAGGGQTIALIDALDDPTAEADLAFYRNYFGLPPCSSATGCFRKLNQNGQLAPLPAADPAWSQEISLDLDMVSAICPKCNILLIEANSSGFADLGAAVNMAASLGPTAISNSYGAAEWSGETGYWESFYDHPGIAVTASAGDNGYGVEFPAATSYVTAVGGTSLNQSGNTGTRNATETVWSGSGAGCSAYEPKPAWQHDGGCANRTVSDVSAVADPGTGVWVYDTTAYGGQSGWIVLGGTSVASPIIASIFGLAANHTVQNASGLYGAANGALFDVTSGNDGACGGTYLCTGVVGYDGPTGKGTPNGTAAFMAAGAPTSTPTATATVTPTASSTPTSTSTPTRTATATPTNTGVAATSTPTPTSTPTTVTSGSVNLGLTGVGTLLDDGDRNAMNGSRITVGGQSISLSSLSAYVGNVDASPHNQFSLAVYADNGGAPGALLASTTSGTLQANHWNTLPVSGTLQANTAYWLMYNTNASSTLLNNLYYNTDPSNVGAYSNAAVTFGTWPSTFGAASIGGWRYSLYASGTALSGAATNTPTATPTPTQTPVPTNTPTVTPTATQTPTSTSTPTQTPTSTSTPTPTSTSTPTQTPTSTSTPTPTSTPIPAATSTATSTPTATATPTATSTPTATAMPTNSPTPTATPTHSATVTLGLTSVGAVHDTGDANNLNGSKITVGAQPLSVTSISVYVGNIDAAPHNQFWLAIYTDSGGAPGALVTKTAAGTLQANQWNTLPITATLTANTSYWLLYNTNGSTSTVNDAYYNDDPSNVGAYSSSQVAFGTWPTSFGAAVVGGWRYSIYVTGS